MSYLYHLIYFTQQLPAGGKNLETGALSTLLRGAREWRSLLMDHGRKEATETTRPMVSGASQRPAIITQRLHGSSPLSPALLGSGCPLSLPGSPVLCPPQPPLRLPGPGIGAALPAVSLSFCFSHQLCLCVSVMRRAAEPRGPQHANPTSATACGLVLVKRLRNFLGLSYVCVCEGG